MKAVAIELVRAGKAFPARIVEDMPLEAVQAAEDLWLTFKLQASALLPPKREPSASDDWRWVTKICGTGRDEHRFFFVVCDDVIEGMMMIGRRPVPSRLIDPPVGCMYIEYIESTPWNLQEYAGTQRRFKGIGVQLLLLAYELSIEAGLQGRLALHSLSEAESFYRKLGGFGRGPGGRWATIF